MLAKRVLQIEPSATSDVLEQVQQLKVQGERVISFGAGEPDFDTPLHIREAAKQAIDDGHTRYTPVTGIHELKLAILDKLSRENRLTYIPENIVVTNGAKHALYNVFQAIIDPGDEVILPVPYWVSYTEMVRLAGGVPVFVETRFEDGFQLKMEDVEAKITPRTKALILTNPHNPTGALLGYEELERIALLAEYHDFLLISDEIYEKLVYDRPYYSIAQVSEATKKRTVVINGVSKGFAMTGWRIGYLAAPREIAKYVGVLQGHNTSNPNSIAQVASVTAILEGDHEDIDAMRDQFRLRRDALYQGLSAIDGFRLPPKPDGAFYLFANIEAFGLDSAAFCKDLLAHTRVAMVPGSAFGMEGYVRLSYSTSMEEIEEGLNRIREYAAACLERV